MNYSEFMDFIRALTDYLEAEKIFIKNPARMADVENAVKIAKELFADMQINVVDDSIQLGSLVVRIDGYDITVRGSREIELFRELISKANNFEIYPVGDEKIRFAIMFDDVLIHAPEGK